MAHISCRDLMMEHFDCGTQSVARVLTHSKGIPGQFWLSHSPQMAHVLCRDPTMRHFDCGMQSVVLMSTPYLTVLVPPYLQLSIPQARFPASHPCFIVCLLL